MMCRNSRWNSRRQKLENEAVTGIPKLQMEARLAADRGVSRNGMAHFTRRTSQAVVHALDRGEETALTSADELMTAIAIHESHVGDVTDIAPTVITAGALAAQVYQEEETEELDAHLLQLGEYFSYVRKWGGPGQKSITLWQSALLMAIYAARESDHFEAIGILRQALNLGWREDLLAWCLILELIEWRLRRLGDTRTSEGLRCYVTQHGKVTRHRHSFVYSRKVWGAH